MADQLHYEHPEQHPENHEAKDVNVRAIIIIAVVILIINLIQGRRTL